MNTFARRLERVAKIKALIADAGCLPGEREAAKEALKRLLADTTEESPATETILDEWRRFKGDGDYDGWRFSNNGNHVTYHNGYRVTIFTKPSYTGKVEFWLAISLPTPSGKPGDKTEFSLRGYETMDKAKGNAFRFIVLHRSGRLEQAILQIR